MAVASRFSRRTALVKPGNWSLKTPCNAARKRPSSAASRVLRRRSPSHNCPSSSCSRDATVSAAIVEISDSSRPSISKSLITIGRAITLVGAISRIRFANASMSASKRSSCSRTALMTGITMLPSLASASMPTATLRIWSRRTTNNIADASDNARAATPAIARRSSVEPGASTSMYVMPIDCM